MIFSYAWSHCPCDLIGELTESFYSKANNEANKLTILRVFEWSFKREFCLTMTEKVKA